MVILPAIDLKDGTCVRLTRGDFATVEKVAADPVETALRFEAAGAKWLHMVDLDGALAGRPVNHAAITAVRAATALSIEVGGGIRSMEDVAFYVERGISRVILGSIAIKEPDFVRRAVDRYGAAIAVGIDAMDGLARAGGWVEASELDFLDLAGRMAEAGVGTIIYTDISKDGTLSGPNLAEMKALQEAVSVDVIASGGVHDIGDIRDLSELNLWGAICGKSIYAGTLNLEEAIAVAEGGAGLEEGMSC
jgi:phosphoribosylformimino-5-aminoimidazole carboxamide ribotide isomerase